jgi:hypothetical protein
MTYKIGGYALSSSNVTAVVTKVMFPAFPQDGCVDAAIILGAGNLCQKFADKAIQLLDNGQVHHIILCGGAVLDKFPASHSIMFSPLNPPALKGETEVEWMKRYLESRGVSETKISFEAKSKNTGENFQNIVGLRAYGEAKSVVLITATATWALMTMRRVEELNGIEPKTATLISIVEPVTGPIRSDNWQGSEAVREVVLMEFRKLSPLDPRTGDINAENYIAKGFCKDVDLKEEIRMAESLPRMPACSSARRTKIVSHDYH